MSASSPLPPPNDDTSSSLLSRVKKHDAAAWLQVVQWIGPFILRWCRRAGLQTADCEEVGQHVLVKIWRGLGNFRTDQPGYSFRGWVYTITKNCLLDFAAHRHGSPQSLPADMPAEPEPSEARDLRQHALHLLVQELVADHVNDRGFQAFYRTAVDGLSAVDVAKEMEMSAAVVRQHKSRWIKRLRDRLREEFGELLNEKKRPGVTLGCCSC